jgi:hypothetical protein
VDREGGAAASLHLRRSPGMYAVVSFVQVRGAAGGAGRRHGGAIGSHIGGARPQSENPDGAVQIGRDYGPSVEILSGIKEGDWVVTSVTDDVRDGVKVRPQQNQSQEQAGGCAELFGKAFRTKLKTHRLSCDGLMVPGTGLEPARLAAHGPKPCASANSAIRASHQYKSHLFYFMAERQFN